MTKAEALKLIKSDGIYSQEVMDALEQEPKTDVLDSIRSEIVTLVDTDPLDDYRLGYNFGLMRVAQIIDRYKGDIS